MKYIVDFYKELDTVNTIIFWGVIIVVLLLLIFSIILANKNRKLKQIIISKGIEIDDDKDLAIKTEEIIPTTHYEEPVIKEEKIIKEEPVIIPEPIIKEEPVVEIKEEEPNHFIAEEHVIEYQDEKFELPNIKKNEPELPNKPYQRNVLREMYINQTTSPIGIIKHENNTQKEINRAEELNSTLGEDDNYLEKLPDNQVERTPYELKQEEDAIISYEELMRKKDQLNTVDEEDAIISMDELIRRSKDEKLYQITDKEENDKFISELKHFRSDL